MESNMKDALLNAIKCVLEMRGEKADIEVIITKKVAVDKTA